MWRIAVVLSLLSAVLSVPGTRAEEKKWRWGDGERSANTRQDRELISTSRANDFEKSPSIRYATYENSEGNYHIPGRPHDFRPPSDYQERPGFIGGGSGGFNGNNYGQGNYEGAGVLTGPVPSWQRPPQYQEFDKCKCTEKFNCQSPGISYGHCDVGKKYCCYNSQGIVGSPIPNRPHHSIQNGVLSGPGGPVDYIPGSGIGGTGLGGQTGANFRPPYRPGGQDLYQPRPPHNPGVLVGPGGPTGIVGRPPGSRPGGSSGFSGRPPNYGVGNGVLTGPGGPTGIVGRPPSGHGGGSFGIRPGGSFVGSVEYNRPDGYNTFGYARSAKHVSEEKEDHKKE